MSKWKCPTLAVFCLHMLYSWHPVKTSGHWVLDHKPSTSMQRKKLGMVGMEADILRCASNQSAVECHIIRHNNGGIYGEFLSPRVLFSAASSPLCRSRKVTSLSVLWASEWFTLQHNYGHAAHTVMLAPLCPGMSILALQPIPFPPLRRVFARLNTASTTGMSLYMCSLPGFHLQ